ncbi:MAG: putative FmdB family regulatory protein [Urechidicola sp.]|jgi:putative FmdB family regulatory protein
MPIYEYVCNECDHAHEELQKISDPLLTDCPACAKPALKKMISAPQFRLSGSGWYETDFKSSNQKNLTDSGDKKNSDSGNKKSNDSSDKKSTTSEKSANTSKKEPAAPKSTTKAATN